MAAITGAFMVGLVFGPNPLQGQDRSRHFVDLPMASFVPIFFVNIGLEVESAGGQRQCDLVCAAAGCGGCGISKILGSGFGAQLGGFSVRESLQLGIGMVSRGEVGLIVASFALIEGLLSPANFAIVVFMVIVATLVTPPLLRLSFASPSEPQSPEGGVSSNDRVPSSDDVQERVTTG
jgi:Kef-type K+ transport system membrane component KefB